jgi:hypothetical protein
MSRLIADEWYDLVEMWRLMPEGTPHPSDWMSRPHPSERLAEFAAAAGRAVVDASGAPASVLATADAAIFYAESVDVRFAVWVVRKLGERIFGRGPVPEPIGSPMFRFLSARMRGHPVFRYEDN